MKKNLLILLFSLATVVCQSQIPYPKQIIQKDGETLCIDAGVSKLVEEVIDKNLSDNDEHYTLSVDRKGIHLKGATEHALFDARQTLEQWVISHSRNWKGKKYLDCVEIDDSPRYGYRSLMLDPARHFIPIDDVKRFIDEMAKYKFNVLQLHLTDDQGWRVEIKSHPELTDGQPFYTQSELKKLIDYAAEKNITIVPELDIPGHTYGLLSHHPELLCSKVDTTGWGLKLRTDVMLCASLPSVYSLYDDIFKEVCQLFPSEYIHLGGDESLIAKNWGECERCQALKEKQGFHSNDEIMGYFFSHFWDLFETFHKKPILWIEMDNIWPPANRYLFPYPKNVTLVTWRNGLTPKAVELTSQNGNNLIMAPGEHCYFDYPQYKGDLPEFNNWGMPILTLRQAYDWNPDYPEVGVDSKHIQGVMGTLWGEAISDINRAFYMSYPRALALSEAGWSYQENRNWDDFRIRLSFVLNEIMRRGIPYRVPFEIYQ